MRKLLIYLIFLFGALGLGYFAHQVKPDEFPELLTIDTDYVISYQEEGRFEVMMFTNQPSHALFQKEEVLRVIMKDQITEVMFELSLLDITQGTKEVYLHQAWTKMIFGFRIPYFSDDIYLEDMTLSFELFDQQEYLIRLGKFSLYASYPLLDWTHLSGNKQEGELLSRLGTIYIGVSSEEFQIRSVAIGSMNDLRFTHMEDELMITVPKESFLLFNPSIHITTEDGNEWIIHNFLYVIDHMLLKESGPLINHYALY
ncbi:MAG: hypothetical protein C4537_01675 [Acholeplasma sp.]|jgi:hypothetical protein|nr:MAG: hypothetical protein C4537_01675 [Acholeplasma sp.]